jgi:hypothetical protein
MKKLSGTRFRELSDRADQTVAIARNESTSEELLVQLSAVLPGGTELLSWDHDRRAWLAAIISIASVDEVIPFITRRQCLHQLIAEHFNELAPQYIRLVDRGIALHPAIYHAAGNVDIVTDSYGNTRFDSEVFMMALVK